MPDVKIEDVPIELIDPNPDNPNEVPDEVMKALKEDIEKRGFVAPVLLRPHPEHPASRFMVIDGEHRWRILGELGAVTVPSIVQRDLSANHAELRTLSMNLLKGEMVPVRLAHLVSDLAERIPESELRQRFAMDQAELQDYLSLANFLDESDDDVSVGGPGGVPAPDDRVTLVFVCTQEQARTVEAKLTKLTGEDPEREAAVLARLAREYMK